MQNVLTPVATIHRAFGTPLQNIPSVTPAGKSGHTPRFMGSCALGVGYGFWLFCLPRVVYSPYPTAGDGAVITRLDPIAAAKTRPETQQGTEESGTASPELSRYMEQGKHR